MNSAEEQMEKTKGNIENAAKLICPRLSCGWSIVWHQFGLLSPDCKANIHCSKCGTHIKEESIHGATYRDMFRLGGGVMNVEPQSGKAYYTEGRKSG